MMEKLNHVINKPQRGTDDCCAHKIQVRFKIEAYRASADIINS